MGLTQNYLVRVMDTGYGFRGDADTQPRTHIYHSQQVVLSLQFSLPQKPWLVGVIDDVMLRRRVLEIHIERQAKRDQKQARS
jgi:hypothetical protein